MNVLRMRPLSRKRRVTTQSATPVRYAGAQNATPVEETLCNRSKIAQKTIPVKETVPGRPECRMRALSHKLHLSPQNAKYCRNRIENEHRVCNLRFS